MLPETLLSSFREIVGEKNVLWEEIDCLLYSYDSAMDRSMPSAVLFPENVRQISSLVKICHKNKIPFVARGAGTNLCGGTIPLNGAVVIAPTKMNRILSVDPQKRIAVVEPGLPNLFLKKAVEPYNLFYAPDPASQKACTIGGNIGTNAGGPHCLKYGVTSHHVLGLEAVLPDGEIVNLAAHEQGPDLTGFFVGSEGTLGIVTQATLNLVPIPEKIETMLVSFPSMEAAVQTVTDIISEGTIPATLEIMDKVTVEAVESFVHAGYPLNAEAILLIEVDGGEEIKRQVEAIKAVCAKNKSAEFRLARDNQEREKLWEGRRGSYPAMARLAPNVLVEDGAVPRNRLPEAVKKIRAIAKEKELTVALICHAGDGNLHPQILFDERDQAQTRKVKEAGYRMLKACVDLGGSISGEHGIGMDKRDAMRWLFKPETLQLFRRIKKSLDPENLCNPDKLIPIAETNGDQKPGSRPTPFKQEGNESVYEPKNEEELCSILRSNFPSKRKVLIKAKETPLSNPANPGITILTRSLNKVLEHEAENFTITAESGISVNEMQKLLNSKNQKVFLESDGTLGSLLAVNPISTPLIRDQILGMKIALADGTIAQFGGKVMKNVAGYDAAKLMLGSMGSLGVILSVTLKTYPKNYQLNPGLVPALKLIAMGKKMGGNRSLREKIKLAFDPENIFPGLQ